MKTLHLTKSIGLSRVRCGLPRVQRIWIIRGLLITLSLVCFGLLPEVRAVTPAPDGGYPGANTAEGDNALLNLTTGINNTAVGSNALSGTATGNNNTAVGSGALWKNLTGSSDTAVGSGALLHNTMGIQNTANG